MKFITYQTPSQATPQFGFLKHDRVINIAQAAQWIKDEHHDDQFLNLPSSLKASLENWNHHFELIQKLDELISDEDMDAYSISESEITYLPPIPDPPAFRDFYAFEQHVKSARALRGLDMDPNWYRLPIFYFSNPNACFGHGADIPYPNNSSQLDFELEFAVIIGNGGANIKSEGADQVISGYTILNDWSARDLQMEEMQLNLGPAKGKDFASSFGPYMVTPDELEDAWGDDDRLHLNMTCKVNGKEISKGNTNDLYHSFGDMIERASMNTKLLPGEYIGSGTVGTGCILELRPENTGGWIKKGDVVTLEVDRLGILENTIV